MINAILRADIESYVSFNSNGYQFIRLSCTYPPKQEDRDVVYYREDGTLENVCVDSTWISQAYRTITLDEPATGDFLTWLQANAVKQ